MLLLHGRKTTIKTKKRKSDEEKALPPPSFVVVACREGAGGGRGEECQSLEAATTDVGDSSELVLSRSRKRDHSRPHSVLAPIMSMLPLLRVRVRFATRYFSVVSVQTRTRPKMFIVDYYI